MQAANQNNPPPEVEFEKAIDEVILAGLKSLGGTIEGADWNY